MSGICDACIMGCARVGKSNIFQWLKPVLTATASVIAVSTAIAPAAAQSQEQNLTQRQIDIPAGALSQSLLAISAAFDIDVLAANNLLDRKNAPAVSGVMSAQEALERILANTDLSAKPSEDGAFITVSQEAGPQAPVPSPQNSLVDRLDEDEIIVTGTKQNLTIQDTTVSAEVFTADRIEEEALFDLEDVIQRTPNVSSVNGLVSNITIRGISRNGTNSAGQGQATNIYIDGAPATDESLFGSQSLWDVEQVEILRGPQSTLQGRNALAGAVFLQTARPSYDWEAKGRIRMAERGSRQYAAAVSGPIIKDQLAFRISVDYQETDGFITNAFTGGPQSSSENLNLRGKLLIEPAALSNLSALLTFEYVDGQDGSNAGSVRAPVSVVDPAFGDFDPSDGVSFDGLFPAERQTFRAISDIKYELTEAFTLAFLGTYENAERELVSQFADASGFTGNGQDLSNEEFSYSGELRLEFDFEKITGLVGLYYFKNENDSFNTNTNTLNNAIPFPISPTNSLFQISTTFDSDVENKSAFASLRYEPSEKWTFDLGLRVDDEQFTTLRQFNDIITSPSSCTVTVPGAVIGAPVPFAQVPCALAVSFLAPPEQPQQGEEFTVFLPRAAITYHINDDLSVFAGARRGYRAGGPSLRIDPETASFVVDTFDPEYLTSYEAGWRSVWLNGDLTFNGTVFLSKYDDQQISIRGESGASTDTFVTNAAASTIYGLELTGDYQVTEELELYSSIGLLHTEFDEFPLSLSPGVEANLSGNEFENAPNVTATLGANYVHSSGFFANASINYQGEAASSIFNFDEEDLGPGLTERVDRSAVVNARLGYRVEHFTVTLFATNLFDEDAPIDRRITVPTAAFGTTGDARFSTRPLFNIRQPQTFGVSLDFEF